MPEGAARERAVDHLYRGQSNDCYWHGLFGGIYISHMRLATFEHLIAAEDAADAGARLRDRPRARTSISTAGPEVLLAATVRSSSSRPRGCGHRLVGHPRAAARARRRCCAAGGRHTTRSCARLRSRPTNWRAARRDPAGAGNGRPDGTTTPSASIHDVVATKEPGLSERLHTDGYERRSALVHVLARTRHRRPSRPAKWPSWASARSRASSRSRRSRPIGSSCADVPTCRFAASRAPTRAARREDDRRRRRHDSTPCWRSTVGRAVGRRRSRRGSPSSRTTTLLGGGGNPAAWWELDGERGAHDAPAHGARDRAGSPRATTWIGRRLDDRGGSSGGRVDQSDRDGLQLRIRLRALVPGQRAAPRLADAARARGQPHVPSRPPRAAGHRSGAGRIGSRRRRPPGRATGAHDARPSSSSTLTSISRRASTRSRGGAPTDPTAAPFHDWTARVTAECYRPNAERGNLRHISFDLGPTLAAWLAGQDPRLSGLRSRPTAPSRTLRRRAAYAGRAMAQAFHHSILPLAPPRIAGPRSAGACANSRSASAGGPEDCGCPRRRSTYRRSGSSPTRASSTRSSHRGRRGSRPRDTTAVSRRPRRRALDRGHVLRRDAVGRRLVRARGDVGRRTPRARIASHRVWRHRSRTVRRRSSSWQPTASCTVTISRSGTCSCSGSSSARPTHPTAASTWWTSLAASLPGPTVDAPEGTRPRADELELPPRRVALGRGMPGRGRRPLEGTAPRRPRAPRGRHRRGDGRQPPTSPGRPDPSAARDAYVDVVSGATRAEASRPTCSGPRAGTDDRAAAHRAARGPALAAGDVRLAMAGSGTTPCESRRARCCARPRRAVRLVDGLAGARLERRLVEDLGSCAHRRAGSTGRRSTGGRSRRSVSHRRPEASRAAPAEGTVSPRLRAAG